MIVGKWYVSHKLINVKFIMYVFALYTRTCLLIVIVGNVHTNASTLVQMFVFFVVMCPTD